MVQQFGIGCLSGEVMDFEILAVLKNVHMMCMAEKWTETPTSWRKTFKPSQTDTLDAISLNGQSIIYDRN